MERNADAKTRSTEKTIDSPAVAREAKCPEGTHFRGDLPAWKQVLVCGGMLALESYITFEEIYLTTTLQRLQVPYALLSLPGAVSGGCGIFVVPLLGLAMDRCRGGKRLFAIGTLSLLTLGMGILIYTGSINLYHPDPATLSADPDPPLQNVTHPPNTSGELSERVAPPDSPGSVADSSSTGVLSVTAALAMAGFTLGDHSYDTSTLTVRTYILSISPASQHDSLLLTTTTMGAVGGCMTSFIGFLDLSKLFPQVQGQVLDQGDAQFLVQSVIFVIVLFLAFISTLSCNSKWLENEATSSSALLPMQKTNNNGYTPLKEEEELFSIHESEISHFVKSSRPANNNYESHENCSKSLVTMTSDNITSQESFEDLRSVSAEERESESWLLNRTENVGESCAEEEPTKCMDEGTKSRLALMVMVFMAVIAMACFFFYITNYVAEVIYKGNPHASPGSDAYDQYVLGTRMASLCMLMFYVLLVLYNFFHARILEKIGMKAEFIVTSLAVTVLTLTLVLTQSMVAMFFTMVPLAAYRSCCNTVPFILANKYAQREHRERSTRKALSGHGNADLSARGSEAGSRAEDEDGGGEGGGGSAKSGSALASVTVMLPLTYFLVCLVAGPLIAITGDTALPIYVSIGAYGLGTLSALIVDFN